MLLLTGDQTRIFSREACRCCSTKYNIKKLIKDPTSTKLTHYERMVKAMGIVNPGHKTAVAQLPFGTFLGCLPAC